MSERPVWGKFKVKCDLCLSVHSFVDEEAAFHFINEEHKEEKTKHMYAWRHNFRCECGNEIEIDYEVVETPAGTDGMATIETGGGEVIKSFEFPDKKGTKQVEELIQDYNEREPVFSTEEYATMQEAIKAKELYVVGSIFYKKLQGEINIGLFFDDKKKNKLHSGIFAEVLLQEDLKMQDFMMVIDGFYLGIWLGIIRDYGDELGDDVKESKRNKHAHEIAWKFGLRKRNKDGGSVKW
jgi:hypothetical protein